METYSEKQRKLAGFKNDLKRKATNEELILKSALEKEGIHFHFQKCFFNDSLSCILDFYFNKYNQRLAVEIDGDQHLLMEQIEKDRHRTEWLLVNRKCKVIRFTNSEIKGNLDHCLAKIKLELGI